MIEFDFEWNWRYLIIFGLLIVIAVVLLLFFQPKEITAILEKPSIKPGETAYLTISFKNSFSDYLQFATVSLDVGDPRYIKLNPSVLSFEKMYRGDIRTKKVVVFASPETVPGIYNIRLNVKYNNITEVFYVPLEVKE